MLLFQALLTLATGFSTLMSLIAVVLEEKEENRLRYFWVFAISVVNFIYIILNWCGVK